MDDPAYWDDSPRRTAGNAIRRLTNVLVTAGDDASELAELATALDALAGRFEGQVLASRYGSARPNEASVIAATNAVTGIANPLAPPIHVRTDDGLVAGSGVFTAAYEGAPGCVHGGYLAAVLESLLPRPAAALGRRVTASMTVRYRRPTPTNRTVLIRAELVSLDGRKARTIGTISVAGAVTVEAEAVVIAVKTDPAGPD